MKNSFENFKMLFKRHSLSSDSGDVCLTSAYLSLSNTAMKQLGINIGDGIAMALLEEDTDDAKLLLAASVDAKAYKVIINAKIKRSAPIAFISIGKKYPDLKGTYFLKRYGSHEKHEWWEMVKEKPHKIRIFNS